MTRLPLTSWTEASGVSLRYRDEGSGDPVLLLHELGGALESWDLVVPRLVQQARVVRCDLRGSGLSAKIREPISFEDVFRDLIALLDELNLDRVTLAGHALGGGIALAFARHCPGRVSGVIVFAPATGVPCERRARAATLRDRLLERGVAAMVDGAMVPSAWPDPADRPGRGFALFRALQKAVDPDSSGHLNAMLLDKQKEDFIPPREIAVRLIAGRHDPMRPPAAVRAFALSVPQATVHEIDAGHFMALQRPEFVAAEIIAFMRLRQA